MFRAVTLPRGDTPSYPGTCRAGGILHSYGVRADERI